MRCKYCEEKLEENSTKCEECGRENVLKKKKRKK